MAKRKRAKAKPKPGPPTVSPETVDQTITLLLTLESTHQVAAALTSDQIGLAPAAAEAAIAEAQRRLMAAAGYDKTHELGRAIRRLNNLYRRSVQVQDCKTALAAQRELNRLLALGAAPSPDQTTSDTPPTDPAEVERAREHLARALPDHADLPLDELARLAATALIDTRSPHP
ncbi:MAG: hypothetical protein GX547_16405 [Phycisphaerae bacterium]|nr:hypothetical protein [Phycisphaerae bacterium]